MRATGLQHLADISTRRRLAFGVLMVAILSGCERYALDARMELLCRKDGGVKVYETITLSPQDYDAVIGYRGGGDWKNQESYYGPNYRYVKKYDILHGTEDGPLHGRGRLTRIYSAIYRRSDDKLLGESVTYGRTGGDLFTFGMGPSGRMCPEPDWDLGLTIFRRGR